MKLRSVLVFAAVMGVIGALAWGAVRIVRATSTTASLELPTTKVKRGRVTLTVAARGELQGGNSEMLTAPMIGGGTLAITYLREPGELINPGDTVVQFDTTEQEYRLKEAQNDLAEAEQQVIKAEADSAAIEEETRWAMMSAQHDVKLAELECRRNPLIAAIAAKQNDLLLEAAQNKARMMSQMSQRNIDSMTLKAKTTGYVNVQQNQNQNMMYWGMQLPPFQLGDTTRAGMAVAQIPDLKNWEVSANVGELDRGHLSTGQGVTIRVVALPGMEFPGKVKSIGGTSGPPWDRHFECRITLDKPAPELRPGMTSNMVITVDTMDNVLWIPSQALFDSDGRTFVYKRGPNGFLPHDVKLVQRSESQAVVNGIEEGALVAMSNPDQLNKPAGSQGNSAMKALSK
jgi:HlyD family secretion protein